MLTAEPWGTNADYTVNCALWMSFSWSDALARYLNFVDSLGDLRETSLITRVNHENLKFLFLHFVCWSVGTVHSATFYIFTKSHSVYFPRAPVTLKAKVNLSGQDKFNFIILYSLHECPVTSSDLMTCTHVSLSNTPRKKPRIVHRMSGSRLCTVFPATVKRAYIVCTVLASCLHP